MFCRINKKNVIKKGFTLVELLIAFGILAILLSIVLIALNPREQIARVDDLSAKITAQDFINASVGYYIEKKNLPWINNIDCMSDVEQEGYLADMQNCINEIEGYANEGYLESANLRKIYLNKCEDSIVLCYNPKSKAENEDAETKYSKFGVVQPGCPGEDGYSEDCYWCKPVIGTKTCSTPTPGPTSTPEPTEVPTCVLPTPNPDDTDTCIDTDVNCDFPDGYNYFQYGTVTYYNGETGESGSSWDRCLTGTSVVEYACSYNGLGMLQGTHLYTFECPEGCVDGACVGEITVTSIPTPTPQPTEVPTCVLPTPNPADPDTCIDSDITCDFLDGNNYFRKGVIQYHNGETGEDYVFTDFCNFSKTGVQEYRCSYNGLGLLQGTYLSFFECPEGCEFGACVGEITVTSPPTPTPKPTEAPTCVLPTPNPADSDTCIDSDITCEFPDGTNPYLKGVVQYHNGETGGDYVFTDYCNASGTYAQEYRCSYNSTTGMLQGTYLSAFPCPYGCEFGACVETTTPTPTPIAACADSDGGENYSEKGTTTGWDSYGGNINSIATYTDRCDGTKGLLEFYCNYQNDPHDGDGYVSMNNHTCPKGCLDGKCK